MENGANTSQCAIKIDPTPIKLEKPKWVQLGRADRVEDESTDDNPEDA